MFPRACRRLLPVFLTLTLAGCFQASLNGPIIGATFTVAPLDQPGQILFSGTTSTPASEESRQGSDTWQSLPPVLQLAYLGNVEFTLDVEPARLYLVTVTGGRDADNDGDLAIDDSSRPVAGEWHAIVTGAQLLLEFNNVTPLTEALYLSLVDSLDLLTASQIRDRLDTLAGRALAADLNKDGKIDYEDALRWSGLYHSKKLKKEFGNLERLSLAIQEGQDQEARAGLANRFLGGKASFGLDRAVNRKRDPDGTCSGRGAALVSDSDLTVATEPPSADCSNADRGSVNATRDGIVASISLKEQGYPQDVKSGKAQLSFDKYDVKRNKMTVSYQDGDKTRTTKMTITAPGRLKDTTAAYQKMATNSLEQQARRAQAGGSLQRESRAATEFDDDVVDANVYGTNLTSWTSCVAAQVVADLEADGLNVPAEFREWAIGSCTSPLAEVDRWVNDTPAIEVSQLEQQIEALELDGCPNCYNFITTPLDGAQFEEREVIYFNGVAPPNARSVSWDFGDGDTSKRWAPQHAYFNPGSYVARFSVEYRNGNSGSSEIMLNIVDAPGDCFDEPRAEAGPSNLQAPPNSQITLTGSGTVDGPAPCQIVGYQWEVVIGNVTLSGANTPTVTFTTPNVFSLTRLLIRLTVTDSDGQTGVDDVLIDVNPLLGGGGV